jgi:hypothetical protein
MSEAMANIVDFYVRQKDRGVIERMRDHRNKLLQGIPHARGERI